MKMRHKLQQVVGFCCGSRLHDVGIRKHGPHERVEYECLPKTALSHRLGSEHAMRVDDHPRPCRTGCGSSRDRRQGPHAMDMHHDRLVGSESFLAPFPNEAAHLSRGSRLAEEMPRMPERRHADAITPRCLSDYGRKVARVLPCNFNAVPEVGEGHRKLPDGDGQPAIVFQRA
jgi:hypothetical protein